MAALESALTIYRLDKLKVSDVRPGPAGARDAAHRPSIRNWRPGGYLTKKVGKDPWGNPYVYVYPGTHGGEFDLYSLGSDNQPAARARPPTSGNWDDEK
ncbi:MAG: type II secretion system protein GspG [Gammaproteobacteria bacterium]